MTKLTAEDFNNIIKGRIQAVKDGRYCDGSDALEELQDLLEEIEEYEEDISTECMVADENGKTVVMTEEEFSNNYHAVGCHAIEKVKKNAVSS